MQCPKCHAAMETVRVDDYDVDRCSNCAGLWFDLREHEHLQRAPGAAQQLDTGDPAVGQAMDSLRDLICPRCSTEMVKMVSLDQPHIRYERCNVCGGAYLDAGEFRDLAHLSVAERLRHALGI